NIYWDNTTKRLTFVPYSETPSSVPENQYQGVFFKFGSLIGISPKGADAWNNSTTPLFVPPTLSGGHGEWYITSADGSLTDAGLPTELIGSPVYSHTNEQGTLWTGTNYAAIPYARGYMEMADPRQDRYVINMPADSLVEFKGDICKYIDPAYRLPVAYEFGRFHSTNWETANTLFGWTKVGMWNTATSDKADGTYINTDNTGVKWGWTENFFPASGSRSAYNINAVNDTGQSCSYWSGSMHLSTNGGSLFSNNNSIAASASINRNNGLPVRCILQE
ncbi:MAG: hypothetical protein LBS46_07065, partial [Dysgonamonadaceae bacterium]|nr:hypothetical protein [Dysgonamonadaceae bacterium]